MAKKTPPTTATRTQVQIRILVQPGKVVFPFHDVQSLATSVAMFDNAAATTRRRRKLSKWAKAGAAARRLPKAKLTTAVIGYRKRNPGHSLNAIVRALYGSHGGDASISTLAKRIARLKLKD